MFLCWNIKQLVESDRFCVVHWERCAFYHTLAHNYITNRKNTQWGSDIRFWVLHTNMAERTDPVWAGPDSSSRFCCYSAIFHFLFYCNKFLIKAAACPAEFIKLTPFYYYCLLLATFFIICAFALSMHLLTELAHFQYLFTFNEVLVFWWRKWRSETHGWEFYWTSMYFIFQDV